MSIIDVSNLSFSYDGSHPVLTEISFSVAAGEAIAIVGPNGAGKSTLLLQLAGCLNQREGEIRINDRTLNQRNLRSIRGAIGLVFQNPDDQLFLPTVREDVAFGPANRGLPAAEIERATVEALRTVGAEHLIDRPPYRLSAGEKRSVSIATVLALSPDILILDEPSASLDPKARRSLIGLLATLNQTRIIATHDLDLALELCPRTIILVGGRLAADGPTLEILRDDRLLEESHLEQPLRRQGCPYCGKG